MEANSYKCPSCQRVRPASAYNTNKKRYNGLQPYCKDCFSAKTKASYRVGAKFYKLAWDSNRRALKFGVESTLTATDFATKVNLLYDGKCAYCGNEWQSIDHVIPLSMGGTNTIENVVPACTSCNSKKSNKTWELACPSS